MTLNSTDIPSSPSDSLFHPSTHPTLQGNQWTPGDIVQAVSVALVLASIILATIVGNALVITAIFTERNLRTVANYLIASLAVADLLVASLVMPILAVKEISHRWVLGAIMCEAWISMDVLCCTASILHLLAIAVDRYWAVTRASYIHDRPVRPIVIMIVLSWVVSALLCIPSSYVWWNEFEEEDDAEEDDIRLLTDVRNLTRESTTDAGGWMEQMTRKRSRTSLGSVNNPDDTGVCKISQDWGFTVYSTMAAFFIPLIAIIIIYAKVYRIARQRIRKKQFTASNKTAPCTEDETRVGESTDEGCLEGSFKTSRCDKESTGGQCSEFRPVSLKERKKRRRRKVFACLCCRSKTEEKNGLYRQHSKEQAASLMRPLSHNEVSCFSLTSTNQPSTLVFGPSFATSVTATTTLTAESTEHKSSEVVTASCESFGRVHSMPTARNDFGSRQNESARLRNVAKTDSDATPPNETPKNGSPSFPLPSPPSFPSPPSPPFFLLLPPPPPPPLPPLLPPHLPPPLPPPPSAPLQTDRSNFPPPESPTICSDHDSEDENVFLKTKESEDRKLKRPIKRQSVRDLSPSSPLRTTPERAPNDSFPSHKSADADDVRAADEQFPRPPKRSTTSQTIESGPRSSAEELHNDADDAFYDETADDGDDETDTNDKADDFSAGKRPGSTDFLTSGDPLNALPPLHNFLQSSAQSHLQKEEQRSKSNSICGQARHGSHKRHLHSGLHLHLRAKPHSSRNQRPTRQTKERRAREKREQARERKAARTLAIITGSFVVCWLPFFIVALVMPFCGSSCHVPPVVESVIAWLGYLNSGLNPVIYTVFNVDFRSAFKKIVFGKRWKA